MSAGQLLMSYPITLPADYDMGIIRERVRVRGHFLDDRAGLAIKVYAIREAGVDGSPVNEYAPFYLWNDAGAAGEFLWRGKGFDGIVRDFGRPLVHTWTPVAAAAGDCPAAAVARSEMATWPIRAGADLVAVASELTERAHARAARPGVHLAAAGIDPATWQAIEHVTMSGGPVIDGATARRVLHVSQPVAHT